MDDVFKALTDPTRRSLLDRLFREDGQTLGALQGRFRMTRFGVMKHLKQLEDAGLVVTKRRGREKLHFLNPVPIRLVHDRWVSKYAEPWAAALSGLKQELEKPVEKIFEIYIRTTPERLWQAITDPVIRSKYNFGAQVSSDWTPGARLEMGHPDAPGLLGEGEVVEADRPRRPPAISRAARRARARSPAHRRMRNDRHEGQHPDHPDPDGGRPGDRSGPRGRVLPRQARPGEASRRRDGRRQALDRGGAIGCDDNSRARSRARGSPGRRRDRHPLRDRRRRRRVREAAGQWRGRR